MQISCLFRCANTSGGQKSNSEGVIQSNAQRRGTESDVRRPHGGCSLLARLWNHVLVHHFHNIVVYCEFNCLQPINLPMPLKYRERRLNHRILDFDCVLGLAPGMLENMDLVQREVL